MPTFWRLRWSFYTVLSVIKARYKHHSPRTVFDTVCIQVVLSHIGISPKASCSCFNRTALDIPLQSKQETFNFQTTYQKNLNPLTDTATSLRGIFHHVVSLKCLAFFFTSHSQQWRCSLLSQIWRYAQVSYMNDSFHLARFVSVICQ